MAEPKYTDIYATAIAVRNIVDRLSPCRRGKAQDDIEVAFAGLKRVTDILIMARGVVLTDHDSIDALTAAIDSFLGGVAPDTPELTATGG